MLNFEPGRHVRGVFASFLGADFNRAVKTLIFGLLGGSGAVLGTPGGNPGGQKLKLLNFEPMMQVRGRFASFLATYFNHGVKTLFFGLFWGSGAVLATLGGSCGAQKLKLLNF